MMRGCLTSLLVCVAWLASCSRGGEAGGQAGLTRQGPQENGVAPEAQAMDQQLEVITDAELRSCLESDGVVVLVLVESTEIVHPGTRSEMVTIHAGVKQTIHGEVGEKIELRRYTSNGDTVLTIGRNYVVAGGRSTRWSPAYALTGFVEVSPGDEQDSAEAHKQAIELVSQG